VLLNKSDQAHAFDVRDYLEPGVWRDALDGDSVHVGDRLESTVPAHGVRVYLFDGELTRVDTRAALRRLMARLPRA